MGERTSDIANVTTNQYRERERERGHEPPAGRCHRRIAIAIWRRRMSHNCSIPAPTSRPTKRMTTKPTMRAPLP